MEDLEIRCSDDPENGLIFLPEWPSSAQGFAAGVARVYASLLLGQEPLGAEFEAIWDANVAALYEP